jgi:hypothetical protein
MFCGNGAEVRTEIEDGVTLSRLKPVRKSSGSLLLLLAVFDTVHRATSPRPDLMFPLAASPFHKIVLTASV